MPIKTILIVKAGKYYTFKKILSSIRNSLLFNLVLSSNFSISVILPLLSANLTAYKQFSRRISSSLSEYSSWGDDTKSRIFVETRTRGPYSNFNWRSFHHNQIFIYLFIEVLNFLLSGKMLFMITKVTR